MFSFRLTESLTILFSLPLRSSVHLPGESAFVPQEDVLHGFYTCRKYLEHYCRLTGYETDKEQREEHIMELLTSLGLQDQADTIVGDLFLKG